MDSPTPTPQLLQRRKNGFEASCEPCRKAKARCDHNNPCERCVRQKKNCHFELAPMSQAKLEHRPNISALKRRASSPIREPKRSALGLQSPGTPNPLTLQTGGVIGYSRRPASFRVGYMGSTGFGAILQENKSASLWENPDGAVDVDTLPPAFRYEDSSGHKFGASILAWLPSHHLFEKVIDYIADIGIGHVFSDPCTLRFFAREFWQTYGQMISDSPESGSHHKVSVAITTSTRQPHTIPVSNGQWLASISGKNTRWEGIGEIFVAMGKTAFSVPIHDPLCRELVPDGTSKKAFACTMLECADACSMLSDEVSSQSSLSQVMLLGDIVSLQSEVGGDTNSELWKRMGALSAAITGLGLHLHPNEAEAQSALYRDTRSCVFLTAFNMDKAVATFVGRPPCLSSRFVSATLPIDVESHVLFKTSSLAELERQVDTYGWNIEGKINLATSRRAQYIIGVLRDEILELSLSPNKPPDLGARIDDLRYRLDGAMGQLPTVFHSTFDKQLIAERDKVDVVTIAQVQLMHMQNGFLLERIDHPAKDERRLLETARSMLSMVVLLWSERDRYPPYRDAIHWFLCCYGIPAASSLAIDLWLQTLTPHANPATSHRARTIQDLSLFCACLEWVGPDDGNFNLCARVAKTISNILERALAPDPEMMPAPIAPYDYDLADISLADIPAFGQDWEHFFDLNNGWTGAMQY